MALEQIIIDGKQVATLKELLKPDLRAVIVGVNPGLRSVSLGHYWQGQHGKLMWGLLCRHGILSSLQQGQEDDDAFDQGIGFADLIRRPSLSADEFTDQDLQAAVPDLLSRLSGAGPVPIIFRYKRPYETVGERIRRAGHETFRIPSPPGRFSDPPEKATALMTALRARLGTITLPAASPEPPGR